VDELEEREHETVARLRAKLSAGDTAGVRADLSAAKFYGLLEERGHA